MCICNTKRQQHHGFHAEQYGQISQDGDSSLLLHACETAPGDLHSALGLAVQKRHGTASMGPWEGHDNGQRSGISLPCGKAERVQPGEDSRNTLLRSFSTLSGLIRKKTAFLPGPVVTGQGTMILNWKRVGLDWIQGRNILMVGGGEIMGQVTQRGWATSPSFEVFKVSWMRF